MGFLRSIHGIALVVACGCYSGTPGGGGEDPGAGESSGGSTNEPAPLNCEPVATDRATLRRLTRFEYNNTVADLLGDTTRPANAFPSEELANGFGNDANAQSVSSLLAEQYNTVAESVALRATATPEDLARLAPCAGEVTEATPAADADACVAQVVEDFVARAFRRPLLAGEAEDFVALGTTVRAEADFGTGIAVVIEAVLQSADFLYRIEHGFVDEQGHRRPTGYEMASRLSYLLWGTMPDRELLDAAEAGELVDAASVAAHAERLLDDPRSHAVVRFFFDNLLPISALSQLERDPERYPQYSAEVGALMREETQRFLEHEIFEGPGTWDHALTAPYTFVNETLAEFYGIPGVQGDDFVQVDLDPTQRQGLLTQAGLLAGTIHSNETNPVVRGAFIMRELLCVTIPLPQGDVLDEVEIPDPGSGATARERYIKHSEDPVCAGCHSLMDPVGLALENYDPIGRWRDEENGVTIDPSGNLPGVSPVSGPIELVRAIAEEEQTYTCFADQWSNFAYGRTSTAADACTQDFLRESFTASGHDVRQLLLELTQTDDFLYLPQEGN